MIYVHPYIDAWYVSQCTYIVPHCTVPHCTMMNMCFTCIILSSINRVDQTHWCWLYLQTCKFILIEYQIIFPFVDVCDRAQLQLLKRRWAAGCEIDEIEQVGVAWWTCLPIVLLLISISHRFDLVLCSPWWHDTWCQYVSFCCDWPDYECNQLMIHGPHL